MWRYKFMAIRRCDGKSKIQCLSTVADSEKEARRVYCGDYILFFHARLKVAERAH
ncbi:host cell division inhibitor Icd-like protein [Pantoea sp. YU22]|uniref:host cell division inhibitor Icd-like protein n=1 Tax=Pantoea sp. YU22 TaxID=2497684 RepID=UPI000F86DC00|nr:host cell division inhibitor Icd-like protein [Pantoea sp. YU22]RTY53663.1 host cell division inhibitor Icd-like protein [Pantoea sp. YU22]